MQQITPPPNPITTPFVQVLVPVPIGGRGDGVYDYAVGDFVGHVGIGSVVCVPLGNRQVYGVVLGGVANSAVPADKIKPLNHVADCPPLPASLLRLVDFMGDYYMVSRGAVLKMVLSAPDALSPEKPVYGYIVGDTPPPRLTPQRQAVLDCLTATPKTAPIIAEQSGVGKSVLTGLVQSGAVRSVPMNTTPKPPCLNHYHAHQADLSPQQQQAVQSLAEHCPLGQFAVTVLDGVTGSGKTEVYFAPLAHALQQGQQVLIVLPEIALSTQWLKRFEKRFGFAPHQWHSDMTSAQRRKTWRAVAHGTARVVVGARSALFLPFAQLGLIVVDEEHDGAYKQDDTVPYHGRDMAVMRANLTGIPCILASATPSVETLANVHSGRYKCVVLPSRFGGQDLAPITAIDLRQNPPADKNGALSQPLIDSIGQTLDKGQQVLLFLNRRGYAPLSLCRTCGTKIECKQCDSYLVTHRPKYGREHLACHHCGNHQPLLETCPTCGDGDNMIAYGTGVERVLEEITAHFPHARPAVATSETIATPNQARDIIAQVESGAVNVLIGTQIIAKGHHFPNLTLVGIVDGDMGLAGGDLRAGERTYQVLQQVAGRAGRGQTAGQVYIQTHSPENAVMQALLSGDRETFINAEITARQHSHYPPHGRLAGIIIAGTNEKAVEQATADLRRTAPHLDKVRILGPIVPPIAYLRGRHRRRFLVHAMGGEKIQPVIAEWLKNVRVSAGVRVSIDIDPYSFF